MRELLYGDGVFETILYKGSQFPLIDFHFERMVNSAKLLNIELDNLSLDRFCKLLLEKLEQNGFLNENAVVRFTLTRKGGGLYLPASNQAEWHISVRKLGEVSSKVDNYGVFEDSRLPIDKFSGLKKNSALPYVMASIYKQKLGLSQVILLNHEGRVADADNSNVFFVKNGEIQTPAQNEGGVKGVMRAYLIKRLKELGVSVKEILITQEQLSYFDEIWFTNAIRGLAFYGDCPIGERVKDLVWF